MRYIKVEFTKGIECLAWQEVEDEQVVRYLGMEGDELVLPEITESRVITEDEVPEWA